jgi:hypothetical protein
VITMRVSAAGAGQGQVAWVIKEGSHVLDKGTESVKAGASFTATALWTPKPGATSLTGIVDPANSLQEAAAAQADNTKSVQAVVSEWTGWSEEVWQAVRSAVDVWKSKAHFRVRGDTGGPSIIINLSTASGPAGCFASPSLIGDMMSRLAGKVPDDVARKFTDGVNAAWQKWAAGVTVPGLPWYPSFTAVWAQTATPTPNIPMPLVAHVSANAGALTSRSELADSVRHAFGAQADEAATSRAIDRLAQLLSSRFVQWQSESMVTQVLGTGPAPNYKPAAGYTGESPGQVLNGYVLANYPLAAAPGF